MLSAERLSSTQSPQFFKKPTSSILKRTRIKLSSPADFNSKLREHGVDKKVTVQKICSVCKDERDVREVLDEIWQNPSKAQDILDEALDSNQGLFEFEKSLVNQFGASAYVSR